MKRMRKTDHFNWLALFLLIASSCSKEATPDTSHMVIRVDTAVVDKDLKLTDIYSQISYPALSPKAFPASLTMLPKA